MLHWMYGKTRWDKIRNDNIIEIVRVTTIVQNIVENMLRWFVHVERKRVDYVVRRVDQIEDKKITRGIRRPRKIITKIIIWKDL